MGAIHNFIFMVEVRNDFPSARELDVLEERGMQAEGRAESPAGGMRPEIFEENGSKGGHEAPPRRPELAAGIEEIEKGTTSGRFRRLVEEKLAAQEGKK